MPERRRRQPQGKAAFTACDMEAHAGGGDIETVDKDNDVEVDVDAGGGHIDKGRPL